MGVTRNFPFILISIGAVYIVLIGLILAFAYLFSVRESATENTRFLDEADLKLQRAFDNSQKVIELSENSEIVQTPLGKVCFANSNQALLDFCGEAELVLQKFVSSIEQIQLAQTIAARSPPATPPEGSRLGNPANFPFARYRTPRHLVYVPKFTTPTQTHISLSITAQGLAMFSGVAEEAGGLMCARLTQTGELTIIQIAPVESEFWSLAQFTFSIPVLQPTDALLFLPWGSVSQIKILEWTAVVELSNFTDFAIASTSGNVPANLAEEENVFLV